MKDKPVDIPYRNTAPSVGGQGQFVIGDGTVDKHGRVHPKGEGNGADEFCRHGLLDAMMEGHVFVAGRFDRHAVQGHFIHAGGYPVGHGRQLQSGERQSPSHDGYEIHLPAGSLERLVAGINGQYAEIREPKPIRSGIPGTTCRAGGDLFCGKRQVRRIDVYFFQPMV
jgi:hypothetical protein